MGYTVSLEKSLSMEVPVGFLSALPNFGAFDAYLTVANLTFERGERVQFKTMGNFQMLKSLHCSPREKQTFVIVPAFFSKAPDL